MGESILVKLKTECARLCSEGREPELVVVGRSICSHLLADFRNELAGLAADEFKLAMSCCAVTVRRDRHAPDWTCGIQHGDTWSWIDVQPEGTGPRDVDGLRSGQVEAEDFKRTMRELVPYDEDFAREYCCAPLNAEQVKNINRDLRAPIVVYKTEHAREVVDGKDATHALCPDCRGQGCTHDPKCDDDCCKCRCYGMGVVPKAGAWKLPARYSYPSQPLCCAECSGQLVMTDTCIEYECHVCRKCGLNHFVAHDGCELPEQLLVRAKPKDDQSGFFACQKSWGEIGGIPQRCTKLVGHDGGCIDQNGVAWFPKAHKDAPPREALKVATFRDRVLEKCDAHLTTEQAQRLADLCIEELARAFEPMTPNDYLFRAGDAPGGRDPFTLRILPGLRPDHRLGLTIAHVETCPRCHLERVPGLSSCYYCGGGL